MNKLQQDVALFMQAAGQHRPTSPTVPDRGTLDLRIDLITEEFDETIAALIDLKNPGLSRIQQLDKMAEAADGVVDLMYVAIGTTLAMGIDIDDIWAEVQRANMAKMNGPIRDDGKRLKPEGWRPPEVERIVREQVAERDYADRNISPDPVSDMAAEL